MGCYTPCSVRDFSWSASPGEWNNDFEFPPFVHNLSVWIGDWWCENFRDGFVTSSRQMSVNNTFPEGLKNLLWFCHATLSQTCCARTDWNRCQLLKLKRTSHLIVVPLTENTCPDSNFTSKLTANPLKHYFVCQRNIGWFFLEKIMRKYKIFVLCVFIGFNFLGLCGNLMNQVIFT